MSAKESNMGETTNGIVNRTTTGRYLFCISKALLRIAIIYYIQSTIIIYKSVSAIL